MSDAFLGEFEVLSEDGTAYRMEGGATLRVALFEPQKVRVKSRNLKNFLRQNLLLAKSLRGTLQEGLLLDGDEVSLHGLVSADDGRPSSYRTVQRTFLLRGSPMIELLIEKP